MCFLCPCFNFLLVIWSYEAYSGFHKKMQKTYTMVGILDYSQGFSYHFKFTKLVFKYCSLFFNNSFFFFEEMQVCSKTNYRICSG